MYCIGPPSFHRKKLERPHFHHYIARLRRHYDDARRVSTLMDEPCGPTCNHVAVVRAHLTRCAFAAKIAIVHAAPSASRTRRTAASSSATTSAASSRSTRHPIRASSRSRRASLAAMRA